MRGVCVCVCVWCVGLWGVCCHKIGYPRYLVLLFSCEQSKIFGIGREVVTLIILSIYFTKPKFCTI